MNKEYITRRFGKAVVVTSMAGMVAGILLTLYGTFKSIESNSYQLNSQNTTIQNTTTTVQDSTLEKITSESYQK